MICSRFYAATVMFLAFLSGSMGFFMQGSLPFSKYLKQNFINFRPKYIETGTSYMHEFAIV